MGGRAFQVEAVADAKSLGQELAIFGEHSEIPEALQTKEGGRTRLLQWMALRTIGREFKSGSRSKCTFVARVAVPSHCFER